MLRQREGERSDLAWHSLSSSTLSLLGIILRFYFTTLKQLLSKSVTERDIHAWPEDTVACMWAPPPPPCCPTLSPLSISTCSHITINSTSHTYHRYRYRPRPRHSLPPFYTLNTSYMIIFSSLSTSPSPSESEAADYE